MNKLDFLAEYRDFRVNKSCNNQYTVELDGTDYVAEIINGEISYYMKGCFDSQIDWIEFDMKHLLKLKNFCEKILEGI